MPFFTPQARAKIPRAGTRSLSIKPVVSAAAVVTAVTTAVEFSPILFHLPSSEYFYSTNLKTNLTAYDRKNGIA